MNVPHTSHSGRPPKPVPRRGPLELAVSTTEAVAPEAPGPRPGTRLRRGVILGILITVAVFVLLQVLPDYLLKELILHRLQEELGQPVSAQRVSVSLLPRIRLSFFDVASRPVDSSVDLFRAERIDVMLGMGSFLSGGMALEKLVIDAPWIVVRRDENGQWSIPLLASMNREPTEARAAHPGSLPVMDLQATKGTISLVDEFRREGPRSREVTGVQASLIVDQSAQRADLAIFGLLPSAPHLSTLSLVGAVTQLNTGGHSVTGLRFSGAVQAGGIDLRQVAALFLPPSTADTLAGTAHIGADFLLVPRQAGHELVVRKFNIESGAIVLTGSANVAGLGTETTSYALTVSSGPVTVQQLLQQVPVEWIPLRWQMLIAEDKPGGTLTVGATVTSLEAASSQPEWTAEALLTNGALIVGSGRTPLRDLSARIILKRDQMDVTELHASSDGVEVTEGTAVVSGLGVSPTLDLTALGRAEAGSLMRLISAVWPSGGVPEALSPMEEVDGNLDLWIHAAGPLSSDGIKLIKGRVDAHDVAFRTSASPLRVHQLSGQVEIVPGRVDIEKLRWRVGGVPVEAWGQIDIATSARFHDLKLLVDVEARELAEQLIGEHDGTVQADWDGPLRLHTTLSGPVTAPQIVGLLDLQDVGLRMYGFHKEARTPAALEFSARLSPAKVLEVQRLEVLMPPARLTARGSASLIGQPSFAGSVRLQPTAIESLPPGIAFGPVTAGTLSAAVRLKGESKNWAAWSIHGWMKLDDGAAKLPRVNHPLRDLAIHLTVNDDTVLIPEAGFTAGDNIVRASGSVTRWRQAPRVALDVTSPTLNVDLLSTTAPSDGHETVNASSSWLRAVTVTASMKIGTARYEQLQLTDVTGSLLASDGLVRLVGLTAETEQGRLTGQFTGRWPEGIAPTIEGFLKVNGVPVGGLLSLVGRENRMKGWLSVDGVMRAEEAGPKIPDSLTSLTDIRVLIEDGRIFESPMIGKMLKLVNLPALVGGEVDLDREGIPFRRLSGLFAVDHGLVKVKELYLDGPVLKISGAGIYDAVSDSLELVMAMNPLQSYSTLLGKIPLIGRLLSGKREGVGATLYEVTGPLQDPNVRVLPAESIGGGVSGFARLAYDILVNAAQLPADLLTSPQRVLEPDRN